MQRLLLKSKLHECIIMPFAVWVDVCWEETRGLKSGIQGIMDFNQVWRTISYIRLILRGSVSLWKNKSIESQDLVGKRSHFSHLSRSFRPFLTRLPHQVWLYKAPSLYIEIHIIYVRGSWFDDMRFRKCEFKWYILKAVIRYKIRGSRFRVGFRVQG